jgi:transposase-like protein
MKCPKCNNKMIPDRWGPGNKIHGYDCDFCERYFTTLILKELYSFRRFKVLKVNL